MGGNPVLDSPTTSVSQRGCTHVCVALLWGQGGWAIKTIQQGEYPKITASDLIPSKRVRRLLALLVVLWCSMDTDRIGMWVHVGHMVHSVRGFGRGNPLCNLSYGGMATTAALHLAGTYVAR